MSKLIPLNRTPEYKACWDFYNVYCPDRQWTDDWDEFCWLRRAKLKAGIKYAFMLYCAECGFKRTVAFAALHPKLQQQNDGPEWHAPGCSRPRLAFVLPLLDLVEWATDRMSLTLERISESAKTTAGSFGSPISHLDPRVLAVRVPKLCGTDGLGNLGIGPGDLPRISEALRALQEENPQWFEDIKAGRAPESVPPYSPMLDFILAPPRNRAERRELKHGHYLTTAAAREEKRLERFGTLRIRSGGWEPGGGYHPSSRGKAQPRPLGKTKKGSYRKV